MVELLYFNAGATDDGENGLFGRGTSVRNQPELSFPLTECEEFRLDAGDALVEHRHFLPNLGFLAGEGFHLLDNLLDLRFEGRKTKRPVAGFNGGLTRGQLLRDADVFLLLFGKLRSKPGDVRLKLLRGGSGFRRGKQLLQIPVVRVHLHLLRKGLIELLLDLHVRSLRTAIGWSAQIGREKQGDENEHAADSGDDIRESEEGDLGIKTSEMLPHVLASVPVVSGDGCWRFVRRSLETMCEWQ